MGLLSKQFRRRVEDSYTVSVRGEEGELSGQITGIGILVLLIRHREKNRVRELAPLLSSLWQTES